MISKQQVKFINSLHLKKNRKQHGMFVAEGAKIVQELLGSSHNIHKIYGTKQWFERQNSIILNSEVHSEITDRELEMVSELSTPNEVLAIVEIPEEPVKIYNQGISLALESIRDPGNMGTMIRLADWYGLKQVICSEDCADAYNSKTVQASMGSIFRVEVIYCNLTEFLAESNLPIYAATLSGSQSLHEFNDFQQGIILIGNESQGLSMDVLQLKHTALHIPGFGKAESLNAAVAAGIFLDTFRRHIKERDG
jgi:TrmH family RNA methyltransferase